MYTIYGKDNCTFCKQAQTLLEMKGIDYQYVDVVSEGKVQELRDQGFKTVPQIWKDGEHIGGFAELQQQI